MIIPPFTNQPIILAMNRFLLAASLLLGSLSPALAQRTITQKASLSAGQSVFLDLKFAHTIKVRPGAELNVQARVSINDNQLNDAYSLNLEPSGSELSVIEKLDEDKLRQSHFEGDCEGGSRNNSGGGVQGGYTRSSKTGGLRPTLSYHKGEYSYCLKVDYEVTVPAGTALRINTISGDIDLSGLGGAITAKTVSGDVKLNNLSGSAVEATSVSGDVDLSWPTAKGAELSLKSITGEVYADSAVTFSNVKDHSYVGYQLHGTFGSGSGPLVKLESVSGDVFFRKQP
jgi:hypothetical protein